MTHSIECPHCHRGFELTEAIAQPILAAERARQEADAKQKDDQITRREQALRLQAEQLAITKATVDAQVAERAARAKAEIAREEQAKARTEVTFELQAAREQLAVKDQLLKEAQQAELEVRLQREHLTSDQRAFDLRLQRAVDEAGTKIREQTRREDEEQFRLKLAQKDVVIENMRKQAQETRLAGERGSQQVQGEAQETDLLRCLTAAFPRDKIERIPKGQSGADILHHVVDQQGRRCGSILVESKQTKTWSDLWLPKLRNDQRAVGAELAVLASTSLPADLTTFGCSQEIWVTNTALVVPLVAALRAGLMETASARRTVEGHQEKTALVYEYVTSTAFQQRLQGVLDPLGTMSADLIAEQRFMALKWAKRETLITRMTAAASGILGDVQGIVGAGLPDLGLGDVASVEDGGPTCGTAA